LNTPLAGHKPRSDARIGYNAPALLKGERAMGNGLSRLARALVVAVKAMLVVAVVLLTSGRSWAIYNVLGPEKDEWGLKYDVQVNDTGGDKVTIEFTLADEGRLKPFYSIEVIAMNPEVDSQGGHAYDVKAPIKLKLTEDGRRVGQVQIRKEFLDRAQIRILTDKFDGKPQQWLANYEVPIHKFLDKEPAPIASPPGSKVTK
jgi:hypothetical protein